ncbi:TPA: Vi polysaccharide biosynthesis glycosyltransferase TviE, partial [Citrobacter braakii]
MITQEEKLAALGKTLLTLKQEKKLAQAVALIDSELPAEALTSLAMLKKAEFLHDFNETARAYALYETLIAQNNDEARYEYARRLYNTGLAKDAQLILK